MGGGVHFHQETHDIGHLVAQLVKRLSSVQVIILES